MPKEVNLHWTLHGRKKPIVLRLRAKSEAGAPASYDVTVSGKRAEKSEFAFPLLGEPFDVRWIRIRDKAALELLYDLPVDAFRHRVLHALLDNVDRTQSATPRHIRFELSYDVESAVRFNARLTFIAEEWNAPWSIREFIDALTECHRSHKEALGDSLSKLLPGIEMGVYKTGISETSSVEFDCTIASSSMRPCGEYFGATAEYIDRLINAARGEAQQRLDESSLVQYFNFPPETKNACEQYLSYFSQFLRDLGVSARTELKEEANQILFSVTPEGGKDALMAVRDALEIYLQLPTAKQEQQSFDGKQDVAVKQLQANVLHLQSQVLLAQSAFESQAATIEAKEETIRAQRMALESFQNKRPTSEGAVTSPEPLFGRSVQVGTFRKFGVEVHWGELLRSLKRRQ